MFKEHLKRIIVSTQRALPSRHLTERMMTFGGTTNYVLVGLRRAGKSCMLYQDIARRVSAGECAAEDVLFVNFEDERLGGMQGSELGQLLEAYAELYPARRPIVYLDEIQNVAGWEKFARRLADTGYRVMITGSNARMLSREIATTLGGRYIPRQVHPFTFGEYLRFHGIRLPQQWEYDMQVCGEIAARFDTYFHEGGIAEAFLQWDRREYLSALYQKVLLGDIVERNRVRNARVFRLLARKLAGSVMQPTSLSRLQNLLKSAGDPIGLPVLKDYLEYMEDAFLTFSVPNLVSPLTERETLKKRYLVDNGLLNLLLTDGETKLLENMVAVVLRQRYGSRSLDDEPQVFYYQRGVEVDFCVPAAQLAIQVCYNLADPVTREREVSSLAKFLHANPSYEGLILTYGHEEQLAIGGRTVPVLPLWKWLCRTEEGLTEKS